jgi:hypothetical protein
MKFHPLLILMALGTMALTIFISVNAVEVAFGRDLPYVQAVKKAQANDFINNLLVTQKGKPVYDLDTSDETTSRKLRQLTASKSGIKLNLTHAIYQDKSWYLRPSQGQYFYLLNHGTEEVQYTVIYTTRDWRGVSSTRDITVGDNVFVETESNDKHLFRVREKITVGPADHYIPQQMKAVGLLLLVENPTNNTITLVRAERLDTQETVR